MRKKKFKEADIMNVDIRYESIWYRNKPQQHSFGWILSWIKVYLDNTFKQ